MPLTIPGVYIVIMVAQNWTDTHVTAVVIWQKWGETWFICAMASNGPNL